MKRILNKMVLLLVFVFALACRDESLDPFRFTELKKGSLLALRGSDGTAGNLDPDANFFFRDNMTGNETFTYIADFISEDQTLLSAVQVYAKLAISNEPEGARKLIKTVPGSVFVSPSSGTPRQGAVTVTLTEILNAMGLGQADTISRTNLIIESDIELTDGTIVPSSAIVNAGLFAAAAFFPAHALNYYAEDSDDFRPTAASKLAGEVVKNSAGAVTSRPVFPLKSGARDTVMFTFEDEVSGPPTISYSPATAVTTVTPVTLLPNKKASDVTQTYFQVIEATAANSTAVTASATGSTWDVIGVTLPMKTKTQTINVDNTIPQLVSLNTGKLIGEGQLVTIKATFNEKMSNKTANRLKVSVSGQGQEGVTNQNMTLSSNGLELTYVYLFKEATTGSSTHGTLTVTFSGGSDEAGNPVSVAALDAAAAATPLVSDIATPPTPALSIDDATPDYDYGTQIKWVANQGQTSGGSNTGRVYWIALTAGAAAPTGFDLDADENGVWTVAGSTSTQAFSASIAVSAGSSGNVFSPLTKNGTLDVWAVFVSNTGNRSAISATPQLSGVVMAE